MQSDISAFSSHGKVLTHAGHRILLAEDDTEFRRLLTMILEADGYEVQQASDGTQIMDWLSYWTDSGPVDSACSLIISDIRMPGCSGIELLTSLHCQDSRIPVILMSAFADEDTRWLGSYLGAVAFLSKPFDMDDLRTIVLNVLSHAKHHELQAQS